VVTRLWVATAVLGRSIVSRRAGRDACWFLHRTRGLVRARWKPELGAWMAPFTDARSTKRSGARSITGSRRSRRLPPTCASPGDPHGLTAREPGPCPPGVRRTSRRACSPRTISKYFRTASAKRPARDRPAPPSCTHRAAREPAGESSPHCAEQSHALQGAARMIFFGRQSSSTTAESSPRPPAGRDVRVAATSFPCPSIPDEIVACHRRHDPDGAGPAGHRTPANAWPTECRLRSFTPPACHAVGEAFADPAEFRHYPVAVPLDVDGRTDSVVPRGRGVRAGRGVQTRVDLVTFRSSHRSAVATTAIRRTTRTARAGFRVALRDRRLWPRRGTPGGASTGSLSPRGVHLVSPRRRAPWCRTQLGKACGEPAAR